MPPSETQVAPRAPRKSRCLLIWQDNLLAAQPGLTVDYLGTGISITPFARPEAWRIKHFARAALFGFRLLCRSYDRIIVPAVDFNWRADASPLRRFVRKAIGFTLSIRPGGRRYLASWLLPKRGTVCVLDRYDSTRIQEDFARSVNARLYLKTNLDQADQAAISSRNNFTLGLLPYWVMAENYPAPAREKDVDLFYCAASNSEVRRLAAEEIRLLQAEGLRVVAPQSRLSPDEFTALIQRAYLTLSPEGHGYHCFRHYEAMLACSVPVINQPAAPLVTDLHHGQTCLLYDAKRKGDLARVVRAALADRNQLREWGVKLRQFALQKHSLTGLGNFITAALETAKASA